MDITDLYKLVSLYMDSELFKLNEFLSVSSNYLMGLLNRCDDYV